MGEGGARTRLAVFTLPRSHAAPPWHFFAAFPAMILLFVAAALLIDGGEGAEKLVGQILLAAALALPVIAVESVVRVSARENEAVTSALTQLLALSLEVTVDADTAAQLLRGGTHPAIIDGQQTRIRVGCDRAGHATVTKD